MNTVFGPKLPVRDLHKRLVLSLVGARRGEVRLSVRDYLSGQLFIVQEDMADPFVYRLSARPLGQPLAAVHARQTLYALVDPLRTTNHFDLWVFPRWVVLLWDSVSAPMGVLAGACVAERT